MEDPSSKVLIGYSNDFNDPAKCKGVATSQIGQKAEFLFQVAGGCGVGVLQAAGQAKVWSFGVDADQKDVDPSVAASALKKVDVAVYTAINSMVKGTFTSGANLFNLKNGGVGYQVDNLTLPADVQTEVDSVAAKIKAGTLTPPADIPA
jgi:basic membrane protein A